MYISKETCKDLDTLYGQFFNLNSLFDRMADFDDDLSDLTIVSDEELEE